MVAHCYTVTMCSLFSQESQRTSWIYLLCAKSTKVFINNGCLVLVFRYSLPGELSVSHIFLLKIQIKTQIRRYPFLPLNAPIP